MNNERNDGGPAFPRDHANDGHNGMSLLDYFAAKALPLAWQAELAEMAHFNEDVTDRDVSHSLAAKRAYAIADAMLRVKQAA